MDRDLRPTLEQIDSEGEAALESEITTGNRLLLSGLACYLVATAGIVLDTPNSDIDDIARVGGIIMGIALTIIGGTRSYIAEGARIDRHVARVIDYFRSTDSEKYNPKN